MEQQKCMYAYNLYNPSGMPTTFLQTLSGDVRIFGSVESRGMSHVGIPLRMIALETTPACTNLTSQ